MSSEYNSNIKNYYHLRKSPMIYCILSSYSCSILHLFSFCFGICSNGYVVIFMHRMTFKDIRKHTFLNIQVVLEFFPNYNRTLQAWCDDIVACHIRFIDLLNLLFVNGEDKNLTFVCPQDVTIHRTPIEKADSVFLRQADRLL